MSFIVKNLGNDVFKRKLNIRIHRDITGPPNNPSDKQDVVWFGVDIKKQVYTPAKCTNLLAYIKPFVRL